MTLLKPWIMSNRELQPEVRTQEGDTWMPH